MMPETKPARVVFLALLTITALLLLTSIGATIWSQTGEEGWVAKSVTAFLSWLLTIPAIAAAGIWSLILLVRRKRQTISPA